MNAILLNGVWDARCDGENIHCEARLPGDNYSALLDAGIIPDPYFRDNEKSIQWVGKQDWRFSRSFEISAEFLQAKSIYLNLERVDTLARIRLNDHDIARVDNMFRRYRFEVKEQLKIGINHIEIIITNPADGAADLAAEQAIPIPYSRNNHVPHQNLLRKPHCHTGWGWGPCLPVSGVYGDISLRAVDHARIEYVYHTQKRHDGEFSLTVQAEILPVLTGRIPVTFAFDAREMVETIDVIAGMTRVVEKTFIIKNPRLWQPAGWGEQYLYDLAVSVPDETIRQRVGLRSIELITEKDDIGESFYFNVNGKKLFARGANWIPVDALPSRQTPEQYATTLKAAVKANMNMIRVWGGGQYEHDCFYDLCDELGLLVWHDFMFACSMYPVNPEFIENVMAETEHQIKRLRSHASLALWCGDNEIIQKLKDDGFAYPEVMKNPIPYQSNYARLTQILTLQVKNFDPERRFWPGSPCSTDKYLDLDHEDDTRGDVHYWRVFGQQEPFEDYYNVRPRFCSEFGARSFPLPETVETYADAEDRYLFSPIIQYHNRYPETTGKILTYMARKFRLPSGFESFLHVSQINQALGVKMAVEFWRSQKPRCMGALYWQLNDVFPVVSLSSIDYGGAWKHLHYHAKRFFAPVTAVAIPRDDHVSIYALNDSPEQQKMNLRMVIRDVSTGAERQCFEWAGTISPDTPSLARVIKNPDDPQNVFMTLESTGVILNTFFFAPYVACELPDAKVETAIEGNQIILTCDAPAFFVWLSANVPGVFSDNSFTLLPNQPRRIAFESEKPLSSIQVTSLRETYCPRPARDPGIMEAPLTGER